MNRGHIFLVPNGQIFSAIEDMALEAGWNGFGSTQRNKLGGICKDAIAIIFHTDGHLGWCSSSHSGWPQTQIESGRYKEIKTLSELADFLSIPPQKPILIGENRVEFEARGLFVDVGCTRVEFETVKRVYDRMVELKTQNRGEPF